jgi:hypothetical protein
VSIRYIELVDYLAIAAEITGLDTTTLTRVAKIDLAESALHAPAAGFGETEFYPDFTEKAAVFVVRRRLGSAALVHRDQRLDVAHDPGRR